MSAWPTKPATVAVDVVGVCDGDSCACSAFDAKLVVNEVEALCH